MAVGQVISGVLPSGAELMLVASGDERRPSDVGFGSKIDVSDLFDPVGEYASVLCDKLRVAAPDELELTFGIGVTAASGKMTALIVNGEAEFTVEVRLLWKKSEAGG